MPCFPQPTPLFVHQIPTPFSTWDTAPAVLLSLLPQSSPAWITAIAPQLLPHPSTECWQPSHSASSFPLGSQKKPRSFKGHQGPHDLGLTPADLPSWFIPLQSLLQPHWLPAVPETSKHSPATGPLHWLPLQSGHSSAVSVWPTPYSLQVFSPKSPSQ